MSYVNEFKRQKERAEKRWREVEETGKTFEEQIGGLTHNGELFPEVSESDAQDIDDENTAQPHPTTSPISHTYNFP